jgi:hypothetical protein
MQQKPAQNIDLFSGLCLIRSARRLDFSYGLFPPCGGTEVDTSFVYEGFVIAAEADGAIDLSRSYSLAVTGAESFALAVTIDTLEPIRFERQRDVRIITRKFQSLERRERQPCSQAFRRRNPSPSGLSRSSSGRSRSAGSANR